MKHPLTRHYVHGDLVENTQDKYFCAHCDEFVAKDHFLDPRHVKNRVKKYQQSLDSAKLITKRKNSKLYRPSGAENILAEIVKQDIKDAKVARSQFYRWLLRQRDREDPIGDLARDVIRDDKFPISSNDKEKLKNYLYFCGAVDEALVAFDEAWVEYSSKRKDRGGLTPTQRFFIFRRDSYRCRMCGGTAIEGKRLEVDHKIAVSKGGSNEEENLWTLCFECNRGKGVNHL